MEFDPNLSPRQNLDSKITRFALMKTNNCFDCPTEQIKNAVLFLILKMVNNKNETEKLTDAVFKEAKRQLSPNISKHNYSSWLFKLASKKAKEYLYHQKIDQIGVIEHSSINSTNNKNTMNNPAWIKPPNNQKKSYQLICEDRIKRYSIKPTNSEIQKIKILSTSQIIDEFNFPKLSGDEWLHHLLNNTKYRTPN